MLKITEQIFRFFLNKRTAGKNVYVFQLPCIPRKMIQKLGWTEGEALELKTTKKGIKIEPIKLRHQTKEEK